MTQHTRDHPEDLLAAYALDLLPPVERIQVERHLALCQACTRRVVELGHVAEVLPLAMTTPATPPTELRDRIVQAAATTPQDRSARHMPTERPRWPLADALGWLAAAALLLVSLGLGAWNIELRGQPTLAVASAPLVAASPATNATGTVIIPAGAAATVAVVHLPPAPAGHLYEAWVISGGTARPAGTFLTTSEGRGAVVLTVRPAHGTTVAITIEPAPGTTAPTGAILLKATV